MWQQAQYRRCRRDRMLSKPQRRWITRNPVGKRREGMSVGWYLREWRQALGLTQQELADRVGIHKGDVSRLERGRILWNAQHLERFSQALAVPAFWLIAFNPEDPASELEVWKAIAACSPAMRPTAIRMLEALRDGGPMDPPPPGVIRSRRNK